MKHKTFLANEKAAKFSKMDYVVVLAVLVFVFLPWVSIWRQGELKAFGVLELALSQAADPLDFSGLSQVLTAISSISVILGVVFVVIQLRQNNKLIELNAKQNEATLRELKSNISFELLEKLTDESYARRRSFMWQTVKKYQAVNWEGFDDSADDFEVRNFAYMYDLFGQLAKEGLVDLATLARTFKYMVALDWQAFEPASKHINERYGLEQNEIFSNFEWLAIETEKILKKRIH
ncbi:MAG TPA: hypothetical protein VK536_05870 [Candidatus Limnocylindrales bacterium]|nr:hypothetical protein [Candidatus Limnocylindrales bacterium]